MKLKFRADPKNWSIFGAFLVFLYILISVIVLNAVGFLNEESFTLNIFLVFSKGLFAPVMVFFIATVIVILASLNSYFFEREKGIGFSSGPKKEHGYNRWCTKKELKNDSNIASIKPLDDNIPAGGIPLYNDGKEILVDVGGYHNMIIGSTGSGKSQSIAFPYINIMAKAGESMIVTDPKGELYRGTAKELEKRGYNIIILNFREPQKGNCWNPFSIPYKLYKDGNTDKAIELLEDLAKNILYDDNNKGQDPFWENTSADYFTGLAYSLFQEATEEEININSINLMATIGEQKIGNTNYIKEFFSDRSKTSTECVKVNSTITAPNETKGSILSVFNQKIQLFSSRETLSEMLSRSDFDMEDIGKKKTAVFIVIQDEKKTYHSLVTIFLKQCYETLVRVAQENPNGKLKYRTNFLLDEFANMPPLSDVDAMVSAARSRNIKLSFIIQNFSQLNDVYGKEKAETIRGNCGNTIYLLSTELAALEEISKMCGEVKSKKDDKTASTPLITVTDLQNFKEEDGLILRSRMRPFKTKLKFEHKIEWGMSKEEATYPIREQKGIKIFDLKEYVDKKREEKLNSMMGNASSVKPPMFDPAMMFQPKPSPNPFNPNLGNKPTFDVDEIVKRLDAKIAELEEEERLENEKQKKEAEEKINQEHKETIESNVEKKINEDSFIDTKHSDEPKITDDQFFDDFFFDDDE